MTARNSDRLVLILQHFVELSKQRELTLGEAIDSMDQGAYALIALILILPYLQPIPMGPLSVLGGITYALMGHQLWRGNHSPQLPQKLRALILGEKTWHILLSISIKLVRMVQAITKPRLHHLVSGNYGRKMGAVILIYAGLLMAIPFGILPFNNLLPGLAIAFYSFSQLENDGLMTIIAWFWLIFTTVYFAAFFIGAYYLGTGAWAHFSL